MSQKVRPAKHSNILEIVHSTVRGLHKIGLIDKKVMEKFEHLCSKDKGDKQG